MKTCPACGCVNEDRATFCQKCGTRLAAAPAPPGGSVGTAPPGPQPGMSAPEFTPLKANPKIVEEASCASCSGKFLVGEDIVLCQGCGKYYHLRCKEQAGACLSPECRGAEETKLCPYCAEKIKKSAVKCRFCGQLLDQSLKSVLDTTPKGDIKEANNSLICGIIGLFCFGFVLGPIAIIQGNKALGMIREDPSYTGKGKATAGIVLGVIDIIGWLVVIISRFSSM